jgi:putative copper export protein
MADALFVIMRWLHFTSFVTLIGGVLYSRVMMIPALETVSPDAARELASKAAVRYRPFVIAAICGLILSGTYNLLTNPGHSVKYHMLLGVKLVLVLHVFAVAFLVSERENPRRARQMTGVIISGLIVLAISAYLRRIF